MNLPTVDPTWWKHFRFVLKVTDTISNKQFLLAVTCHAFMYLSFVNLAILFGAGGGDLIKQVIKYPTIWI